MMAEPKKSELIRRSGRSNMPVVILALLFIPLHPLLGLTIPAIWLCLIAIFAALLWYASMTVIIASQDLDRYGSFLAYEALLRFAAAIALFCVSPFLGWFGLLTFAAGVADFYYALVYCVTVPQATGRSLKQLLAFNAAQDTQPLSATSTAEKRPAGESRQGTAPYTYKI